MIKNQLKINDVNTKASPYGIAFVFIFITYEKNAHVSRGRYWMRCEVNFGKKFRDVQARTLKNFFPKLTSRSPIYGSVYITYFPQGT